MSTKNKVNPVPIRKVHKERRIKEKDISPPLHQSECAFHNSRLNLVSHFGNKIMSNINFFGEIIGCSCGKINARKEKKDNFSVWISFRMPIMPHREYICVFIRLPSLGNIRKTQPAS